ncbi:hypothetical protein [Deinococcus altitudinis]|uniref:hypothetical protein n=1 Tax=Deinococcus altitudinis TaxID=468914 RepID=UPI003892483C
MVQFARVTRTRQVLAYRVVENEQGGVSAEAHTVEVEQEDDHASDFQRKVLALQAKFGVPIMLEFEIEGSERTYLTDQAAEQAAASELPEPELVFGVPTVPNTEHLHPLEPETGEASEAS